MRRLLSIRYLLYLSLIGLLVAVLAFGEDGPFSFRSVQRLKIFKAPSPDESVAFVNEPVERSDQDSADKNREDPDADEREFNAALNRLSSNDSQVADGSANASAAPTAGVPATPATVSTDTNQLSRGTTDGDPGDMRQMFVGLQENQGSRINEQEFLGGVVVRSNSLGNAPDIALTPRATPSAARPWVQGQARGYTMLYAMQPEARNVVESHVQTLLASRVREPYIGVLIDGTFGRDFSYLKDIIGRLSLDGRDLTLALYLSNGPTMRDWRTTPIDALFSRIDPAEFRASIRRNQQLRGQFLAVAAQARDLFLYNVAVNPGNNNVAIVMLEDNLDVAAYRSMRDLANEQLESIAGFVRNPCFKCFDGNDDDTAGNPREEHQVDRFQILKDGDGYSLDGVSFRYPNGSGNGVSAEQLSALLNQSVDKGLRYFGLWREEWQGVKQGTPNVRPVERTYVAPTPDEQEFEIQALRTGLFAESADEE